MSRAYAKLVVNNQNMIKRLVDSSGLHPELVQNFLHFSQCLVSPLHGFIDMNIWKAVMAKYFYLANQLFVVRMYESMSEKSMEMSVEHFCRTLCLFASEYIEPKIELVFNVFDINNDRSIDKRELALYIGDAAKCLTDRDDTDRDETFTDLVDIVSKMLGITNEPTDFEGFRQKVKGDLLLLQCLGQVLPHTGVIERFKTLVQGKTRKEIREQFKNIRFDLLRDLERDHESKLYPLILDLP